MPKSISETRLFHPDRRYPRQEGQSHRQLAHESTGQPPRGPGGSDDGVSTRRSRPSAPTVFASRVDLNPAGVKSTDETSVMATYFTVMFAGPISQMNTARVKEERSAGVPRYTVHSPTPKQRDGARMGSQPVQRQKTKEPLTLCHVQHEAQPRGSGRRPGRGR